MAGCIKHREAPKVVFEFRRNLVHGLCKIPLLSVS